MLMFRAHSRSKRPHPPVRQRRPSPYAPSLRRSRSRAVAPRLCPVLVRAVPCPFARPCPAGPSPGACAAPHFRSAQAQRSQSFAPPKKSVLFESEDDDDAEEAPLAKRAATGMAPQSSPARGLRVSARGPCAQAPSKGVDCVVRSAPHLPRAKRFGTETAFLGSKSKKCKPLMLLSRTEEDPFFSGRARAPLLSPFFSFTPAFGWGRVPCPLRFCPEVVL